MNAFRTLDGVQALPIFAGGLDGAERSIVLLIKGDPEAVRKAVELAEEVKGAEIPQVRTPDCPDCRFSTCKETVSQSLMVIASDRRDRGSLFVFYAL